MFWVAKLGSLFLLSWGWEQPHPITCSKRRDEMASQGKSGDCDPRKGASDRQAKQQVLTISTWLWWVWTLQGKMSLLLDGIPKNSGKPYRRLHTSVVWGFSVLCVCVCVHSELSDILGMWWFSQCPGSKEMAHSKGLSKKDHLDVGRVSQGRVVRFPGLAWSSKKKVWAYQSPVRAGPQSYGEHSHCLSSSKQGRKMRSNYSSLSLFPASLFMLLPLIGQTQTEASVEENPGEQGKEWRTTCWLEGLLFGRKV